MKTILKFAILFIFLSACTDNTPKRYSDLGSAVVGNDVNMNADIESESLDIVKTERKLIKKGRVEFETENLEETHKNIITAVKKHNAYVSADRFYKNSYRLNNTIELRIPTKNFDAFLENISKNVKKFDTKEITVSDVTEQFLDAQTRLATKKKIEKRYLEILQRAKSVTEILQVERQIGVLRTEIESIEGRLKYLKNQISFSTLNITFYKIINSDTNFSRKFKNGFKNGFDNLVWFFVALINIWPFIIIIFILVFLFRRWRKKKQQ